MTQVPPPTRVEGISARLVRFFTRSPIHVVLGIIGLIWLVPTIGLLITSFRPRSDIQASGWWETLFSFRFTLDNYAQVITGQGGMGHAFVNSLLIAVPSTLLPMAIGALAAYALTWTALPHKDLMFVLVVAFMLVPVQVAFIPVLKLFAPTGLLTGFVPIWLAHTAFALPFGIFLMRNFFILLPRDLIEASRMDGAGDWTIFRRVVVPLSVPAIAAYGIFQFLWVWNDLLMSLIFVQSTANNPMPVQLSSLLGQYGSEWNLLAAGAFLLMAVPLIVFFALQRYFVQGLLAGSVK